MALLDEFFGALSGDAPAPTIAPTAAAGGDRLALGRQIYDYFVAQGLAPHQAAAVAGNMVWESGGNPSNVSAGDNTRNSPSSPHSAGLGQWNDRLPALISYARQQGVDIPAGDFRDANYVRSAISRIPVETQLGFAWSEMQGPEARALAAIRGGSDVRSATAGAIGYHRPAGFTWANPEGGHGFAGRLSLANQILGAGPSSGTAGTGLPPVPSATIAATGDVPAPARPETPNPFGSLYLGTPAGIDTNGNRAGADAAARARLAMDQDTAPEPGGIAGTRLPRIDMTRLRSLMARRGTLGTMRG